MIARQILFTLLFLIVSLFSPHYYHLLLYLMKLCPLTSPDKHGTECVWYYPAFAAFTVVALLVRKTTFRPRKLTGLRLAGDFDFLSFGKYSLVLVLLLCVCVCICNT